MCVENRNNETKRSNDNIITMAVFRTRVTDLLGIDHPVVMGGMTGVGTPELAAAVSNAGGLGIMAIHNSGTPEQGRQWIRRLKALTSKPFGINLTILPKTYIGGKVMMDDTISRPPYEDYVRVIIEERVKIVETAGRYVDSICV